MTPRRPLLHLLLFISTTSFAQNTLVGLDDIAFTSAIEKSEFEKHFNKKQTEYFNLFMASGQKTTEDHIKEAAHHFNARISTFDSEKFLSRKNDKKVKAIYDDVHAAFFRKYELENHFEDIFINGYYNCVSATAMYAMVFENLKIPYVIKEKPTHVYLIAYPAQERIILETTTPVGGSMAINPQFKQSYVKILRDQKLISASEYSAANVNALFDKFYFGDDKDISLTELIGIQYSNQGIYLSQNKKYAEALMEFKKSYMFYPSDRVANMMLGTAYELFHERQSKDSLHAATLGFMARFQKYGITNEMIKGEYSNVVQDLLFNRSQADKLKAYHRVLMIAVQNDELKGDLDFFYNYENGRMLYNQARYKEALPYFEACVNVQPGNQEGIRILIACIAAYSKTKTNSEIIALLENLSSRHSTLFDNNVYNEMLGASYLIEMRNMFASGNAADGEKYKTQFESFYQKHSDAGFNHYLIGDAYSAAAVLYFKKGNSAKAKAILNKGLTISPNNYELTTRKKMIN
jgi:tetratricopeptide (TPR) repeat protein